MPYKYTKNDSGLFVCEQCGKTTVHRSTMFYHYQKHDNNKEFECEFCDFTALTQQILDLHRDSRHRDQIQEAELRPVIRCPFDGCNFQDIRKGNTITHFMRTHLAQEVAAILDEKKGENGKIFCCKTCDEEKKNRGSFLYHSVGCITLPMTDPRYQMLASIM
jgi:DNA-directed RNA polymerase subunit M/transcription elongation factor TFIIS